MFDENIKLINFITIFLLNHENNPPQVIDYTVNFFITNKLELTDLELLQVILLIGKQLRILALSFK